MMFNELVSIIIPVYNAEKYLCKCLDSVLYQSYKNLEIICVNDGSIDKSLSILSEYQQQDDRITIIDITNHGVSNARNLGLGKAKGEWVMFVDSDDWLEKECIDKLLDFSASDIIMFPYISEHRDYSKVRRLFDDDRAFEGETLNKLARRVIGPVEDEIINPAQLDSFGTVWGKIYKRKILRNLKFVDLNIIGSSEDSLFNMYAFKQAQKIYYTNSCCYHYRKTNDNSITAGYNPSLKECWKELYNMISLEFSENEEKKALLNRIAINVLGESLNEFSSPNPKENIKALLYDQVYATALLQFNTNYLPFYWKIFYILAKRKFLFLFIILVWIIKRIIS